MSYRTYINGHEWLGNNEMYDEIYEELKRQGCPFDGDGCVGGYRENPFEVKDLNGLVMACEKALIRVCSNNGKVADFNDYVLKSRCNSMTLGLLELSDCARIFIGANLLRYVGKEFVDWDWHPKTGFKLIGNGKCIFEAH